MWPPPNPLERKVMLYDGPFDGKYIYCYGVDGRVLTPPTGYQWVQGAGYVLYGQHVTAEVEETRRDK